MKKTVLPIVLWTMYSISPCAQPTITADGPLEFCDGESVTLCVEPDYASYLWCSGSTTQCITVTQSGEYCVVLLDSQGNLDSTFVDSSITIIVHEPEPIVLSHGDTLSVYNFEQFVSFQWYWTPTETPILNGTDSFIIDSLYPCCSCCYGVEVTDSMGCSGSSYCNEFPVLLPDSCYEGIEESEENYFTLLPNPASQRVSVHFTHESSIRTISIWDSSGKQVFVETYLKNLNNLLIETEDWPNGMYLISVLDASGYKHSEKLIVQH